MRKVLILTLVLVPLAMAQQSADEKALRDTEMAWAKAAQAKDVEKFASYYADDASLFQPNMKIVTGKVAIHAAAVDMFKTPGFSLSFKGAKAEVAKSGEMGYTTGAYHTTMNDPNGKPMKDTGKYVTVFKKVGGQWKAVADIFNSDLPAKP